MFQIYLYLNLKKGSKLLDIACGKGRHATYFNSLGFDVVGIDLSPNNITSAKNNENTTLKFEVHDSTIWNSNIDS